ncbi:MAG: Arm DNA-binding domain-containing protein [Pseudomonas proteolytica]|uniref:Arm DNA-binding domain-containing protein n=1 Tax=Pseudomonas proteolytica TaxID=219574 RepID=UPI003F342A5A
MPLTALQTKASNPADKPFTLSDSSGLALLVKPNGSKYWHFRHTYQVSGKRGVRNDQKDAPIRRHLSNNAQLHT